MLQVVVEWSLFWIPLVALCSLPWTLQLVIGLAQLVHQHLLLKGEGELSEPARRWLERAVRREGLRTRVEVHEALGEGYFPQTDIVGLSPRAAASAHPVHRAVVAHELGHAANTGLHPALRALAPIARLCADALPHAFAAALLIGAMHSAGWLLIGAALVATLALVAHGLVLLDEAGASYRAWSWLRADVSLSDADRGVGATSMISALSSYAAPVLAWVIVLALTAWWMPHALSGGAVYSANPVNPTGTWMFILLVPVLLLQAGYVLSTVVRPEPVRSSFRLEMVAQRDNQWGFVAGLCVAVLVVTLHNHLSGPGWILVLAVAAFAAVGPASVFVRASVLVPLLALSNAMGLTDRLSSLWPDHEPDDSAGPEAVVSLFENPPWYLRSARLLQLAWVPMVAVVVIEAAGR